MNKIWFIEIDGKLEGPYSVRDLKYDIRVTPDTLAWKKGFVKPVPIRNIAELKAVFEDEIEGHGKGSEKKPLVDFASIKAADQEIALDLGMDPFKWWLLILVVLLLLFFSYVLS